MQVEIHVLYFCYLKSAGPNSNQPFATDLLHHFRLFILSVIVFSFHHRFPDSILHAHRRFLHLQIMILVLDVDFQVSWSYDGKKKAFVGSTRAALNSCLAWNLVSSF